MVAVEKLADPLIAPYDTPEKSLSVLALEPYEMNGQGDPPYHQALDEAMEQRQGSVQFRVRFQLLLEAMIDQRSEQMGIRRELVYSMCVRQVGAFNTPQNYQQALDHVLQSAMEEHLEQNSVADRNGFYFHLASSLLQHVYEEWGLTAGE